MKTKLLIGLLLAWICYSSSQNNPVRFQHLTVKEGLSQGHILCMMQDSKGYIWIGTYYGLNRYNGYSFDVFTSDKSLPNTMNIDVAYSLFEDKDGNIWVGTWGVDIFNRKTEKFTHIPFNQGKNSISAGEISDMCQDAEGNMWLATRGGGLNRIDYITKKIHYFRANANDNNSLNSDFINDILIDKNQTLWIATEDGGLSKINLKNGSLQTYRYSNENSRGIPSDKITSLFMDKDQNLWIGDNEGHLARFNSHDDSFILFDYTKRKINQKNSRITQIEQDWKGDLLVATNGSGFIIYNYRTGESTQYLHDGQDAESILSNEISSLFVDKTNTVFIGTYGRGISKYSASSNKFEIHRIPLSQSASGDINAFTDCIEDYNGNLVAGTYSGFIVFDKKNWSYRHYLPGKTYEENKILTLTLAPDSSIWLGSMRYLYRYDNNFRKIQSYLFDENLKDHSIYTILFDSKNNLWIGLFRKGIIKILEKEWRNKVKKKLDNKYYFADLNDSSSISGNQPWTIVEDKNQNLWFGNEGGICKYNFETDNFTRFFNQGTVKVITADSEGKIWFGTIGKGLYSLDLNTLNYNRYTVNDGLCHSFIYGMIIDKKDNIWISTESGLSKFNIETGVFRNYDTRDGLPVDQFDDKSENELSDGRFYMGTNKGFILFDPEKIKDDTSESRIVIAALKINNKVLKYYRLISRDSIIDIPINQIEKITLKPDQRDISIEFAALHYAAPQKIQYEYKLEGYDKDWITTDALNRIARYTNLDRGTYIFNVKATNSDGKWYNKSFRLKIVVIPPFYRTTWFALALGLFVIFLVFIFFQFKISQEIKQKEKLANLVDERTIEITSKNKLLEKTASDLQELNTLLVERQQQIEKQNEEIAAQRDELAISNTTKDTLFSIIAHDLKNPFNVIMGYTELIISNYSFWQDDKKLYFMSLLKESTIKAYNLLENLLQWSRSQNGTLAFHPVPKNSKDIIGLLIPEIISFAHNKEVNIIEDIKDEKLYVHTDINMLITVLRNLVTNAIKFSKSGDNIILSVEKYNSNHALFKVIDHGVGMNEHQLENLFKLDKNKTNAGTSGEKGTGLGLILCKELIGYHNGNIRAESELGKGTTIFITIPLINHSIKQV